MRNATSRPAPDTLARTTPRAARRNWPRGERISVASFGLPACNGGFPHGLVDSHAFARNASISSYCEETPESDDVVRTGARGPSNSPARDAAAPRPAAFTESVCGGPPISIRVAHDDAVVGPDGASLAHTLHAADPIRGSRIEIALQQDAASVTIRIARRPKRFGAAVAHAESRRSASATRISSPPVPGDPLPERLCRVGHDVGSGTER